MKSRIIHVLLGILGIAILVCIIIVFYCMTGTELQYQNKGIIKGNEHTKSIVVYFTRAKALNIDNGVDTDSHASIQVNNQNIDGNTEIAAKMIQQQTGSDLYSIQVSKSYRTPFLATSLRAWLEKNLNMKPDLSNMPADLDDYDVIYLGFPIWWYQEPMAVDAFLENYDFKGKTIVPFCTSTSSSIDESVQSIQSLCPEAKVLKGLRNEQANEEDIDQWLENINIGG